ncbi:M24 family metallopeptidase [Rosistilla oblonga]|uniref:Xaa-Pro dipeptidase n=1 Tax=Rosistilla oblonga TaxID=2527990 RepID=A0A518IPW4_9BACT|nr:M24 family metallopeptidase [Rosistilla oblonga]QDV55124.1 Xaa-Pro dipeptidase [Rosistilla oblonga]
MQTTTLLAGIPAENASLFHRMPLSVGDPAAWIQVDDETTVIVRDIEVDRARRQLTANHFGSPGEYAPAGGLSPDRATATAQAVAEFLARKKIASIQTDRTLPFIFAWHIQQAGIEIAYNADLGVIDRRSKSDRELECLQTAQEMTQRAMELACRTIAASTANASGQLVHEGELLTSERVKAIAAQFFLEHNFAMEHGSIVATAPEVADCHHGGAGPLRTEVPIVVDLFPRDLSSRYWGDCTRTVVHGQASEEVKHMHAAVVQAKAAATAALRVGNTGDAVHQASTDVLLDRGYPLSRGTVTDHPSIQHGTGHGIGLEIHEPILLDDGGPEILPNEVLTIEPGLYGRNVGGVRVEDMVAATTDGPVVFGTLHQGLDWK